MGHLQEKGNRGEAFVCERLVLKGWKILARNFRRRGTEIDIVAQKEDLLSIVEVKFRRILPVTGLELMSLLPSRKRHALKRGAELFVMENPGDYYTIRFDLAIVYGPPYRVKYYSNVMEC